MAFAKGGLRTVTIERSEFLQHCFHEIILKDLYVVQKLEKHLVKMQVNKNI